MLVATRASIETELTADAVAFCPDQPLLVCACYQLLPTEPPQRLGQLLLYSTDGGGALKTRAAGRRAGASRYVSSEASRLLTLGAFRISSTISLTSVASGDGPLCRAFLRSKRIA